MSLGYPMSSPGALDGLEATGYWRCSSGLSKGSVWVVRVEGMPWSGVLPGCGGWGSASQQYGQVSVWQLSRGFVRAAQRRSCTTSWRSACRRTPPTGPPARSCSSTSSSRCACTRQCTLHWPTCLHKASAWLSASPPYLAPATLQAVVLPLSGLRSSTGRRSRTYI